MFSVKVIWPKFIGCRVWLVLFNKYGIYSTFHNVKKNKRINRLDHCCKNVCLFISLLFVLETIMGTEMNAQKGKSAEYVHSIKR